MPYWPCPGLLPPTEADIDTPVNGEPGVSVTVRTIVQTFGRLGKRQANKRGWHVAKGRRAGAPNRILR